MEMIVACVLSFAVTGLLGWKVILPALRRLKAGQEIREVGPKWHATKAGTPTMGGLMFIIGIAVAILAVGWPGMLAGDLSHIYVFLFAAVFGCIGFLDDFEKVKLHRNLGLTAAQKFVLQLAAAIAFLCLMRYEGMLSPELYVPFLHVSIPMSWPLYMVFSAFVIVGAVNAVNLTDGLDGLATSVTIPVALFFASVATWWGYTQLGIFSGALLGGLLAFLLFNAHPYFWEARWRALPSPSTCPWCWCLWASSISLRRSPTSCRWPTSSSPTESGSSRWPRSTTTLRCAAGAR